MQRMDRVEAAIAVSRRVPALDLHAERNGIGRPELWKRTISSIPRPLSFRAQRGISSSHNRNCQVIPRRVGRLNQRDLLLAPPALDLLFARDRRPDIRCVLAVYKTCDAITPGKFRTLAVPVLEKASRQVIRHPDIESARQAGEDIDPVSIHDRIGSMPAQCAGTDSSLRPAQPSRVDDPDHRGANRFLAALGMTGLHHLQFLARSASPNALQEPSPCWTRSPTT